MSYPARTRDISPGSSVLSGKIVIPKAAADGTDVVVNFNRSASQLTAHSETYSVPNIKTGSYSVALTAYADVNQGGAVVSTATATQNITCSGLGSLAFSLSSVITNVAVPAVSIGLAGGAHQLAFTCTDAKGATVAVTPGSATFALVAGSGTAATLSADGIATPTATGTIQVTATVDGIKSAAATITVSSGSGSGSYTPTAPVTTAQVYSYSSSGSFVAINYKAAPIVTIQGTSYYPAVYGASFTTPDSGLQTLPIPTGYNFAIPRSINNNGAIVGEYGLLSAGASTPTVVEVPCYWSSPSATPTALALPAAETSVIQMGAISKSGAIYGHTRHSLGGGTSYGNNYVWPTPTSQPIMLEAYAALNYEPSFSISDGGVLVVQGTDLGTLMYSAPYTSPKVLTTPDGTPGGISVNFSIGPDGTIFGNQYTAGSGTKGFYILGPAYGTGVFLPGTAVIYAMNSTGQACGESDPGGGNFGDAWFWNTLTSTPENVPSGSPGNQAIKAVVLLDNDIMKVGDDYGNYYWVQRH